MGNAQEGPVDQLLSPGRRGSCRVLVLPLRPRPPVRERVGRLLKLLVLATLAALGLAGYSYLSARFTVGQMLGPNPPLSGRAIVFAYRGVPELPGHPRAWVFSYERSELEGVRRAQIVVSPTGRIIATRPRDLQARLLAWQKARLP